MNDFLKELFAENEKLSFDELDKKIQDKGFKLADLSKGNYVDKQKYDDDVKSLNTKYNNMKSQYDKAVEDNDKNKTDEQKNYEDLMKQFNEIKTSSESTAKELDLYKKKESMRNNGIENQRFMDLALFELKDSQDFDTDIKKWAEDNKSLWTKTEKETDNSNSIFRTNPSMNGNPNNDLDEQDTFMKSVIKGAGLKAEDFKK